MSEFRHVPVMAAEVARLLLEAGGKRFLDCTAGGGGHILALLSAAGRPIEVLGIDIDPEAVERARRRLQTAPGVLIIKGDYGRLHEIAAEVGLKPPDGVLSDFGQSSDQLEDPARGMSHRWDVPVDMRYDPSSEINAGDIINRATYYELLTLFRDIGQERQAPRIARAIINERPLHTTSQLEHLVRAACSPAFINKTLARVFMALRVVVNDELTAIERFLPQALGLLAPGGRIVCISYDSHQDSRVKEFFRSKAHPCVCPPQLPTCVCGLRPELRIITGRAVRPSAAERESNPRSRSARLRAAEKLKTNEPSPYAAGGKKRGSVRSSWR